jgi:hypothetical protein
MRMFSSLVDSVRKEGVTFVRAIPNNQSFTLLTNQSMNTLVRRSPISNTSMELSFGGKSLMLRHVTQPPLAIFASLSVPSLRIQ